MSRPDPPELQKRIGYGFRNEDALIEALTHKSFHHEHPEEEAVHNERLEFMGDSVLGLVVAEYLFGSGAELNEAGMSRIKAHIVKGRVLAEVAREISLGNYLRLGKGEEESGGRKKVSILANALEALFGAVFADGGYERAKDVILELLRERVDAAIASGDFADFKSDLQELCQVRFGSLPEYRLVEQEGQDHLKVFTFEVFVEGRPVGRGRGASKKEAQTRAAEEALRRLGDET
ncbi:MAG: ribonuclease III [Nitrospirota bacterium]|jgi:ribonuclease-3